MSAYRQAMLSVPPERVEQFSLEVKQRIAAKKKKKSSSRHKHSKSKKIEKKHGEKEKSNINTDKTSSKATASEKRRGSKEHKITKKKRKITPEHEVLTDDSDVEESGLDLSNEIFPLSHYVKDRQKLFQQLFHIVKNTKLIAMLPDILKDIPLEELKQKCFSHLEVMSSKRINHILSGEPMQSSSGTDSEDEESKIIHSNEALAKEVSKTTLQSHEVIDESYNLQANFVDSTTSSGCEVLSLLAAGSAQSNEDNSDSLPNIILSAMADDSEAVSASVSEQHKVSCSTSPDTNTEVASASDAEEIETVEIVEDVEYSDMVDAMLEETLAPSDDQETSSECPIENKSTSDVKSKNQDPVAETGLSQLELLELQLRARAIKSLMKAAQV